MKLYSARSSFPHIQAPSWLINESLKWKKQTKKTNQKPINSSWRLGLYTGMTYWWACLRNWRHTLNKMGPSHHVLLSVFCMNWAIGLCFYPHFSRSRWILMESDSLPWNPGPATSLLCDVSCLTSAELRFLIYAIGAIKYLLHSFLVGVGLLEITMICSMGVSYDYCSPRVSWVESGEPCQLPLKYAS